jgi:hypothetical protein
VRSARAPRGDREAQVGFASLPRLSTPNRPMPHLSTSGWHTACVSVCGTGARQGVRSSRPNLRRVAKSRGSPARSASSPKPSAVNVAPAAFEPTQRALLLAYRLRARPREDRRNGAGAGRPASGSCEAGPARISRRCSIERLSSHGMDNVKPPPPWMVRLNVAILRRGLKIGSQHLLSVRGRRSGELRSTPISIATVDGTRYIVAAFADAAWVGNVRAAGSGILARGRNVEPVRLIELPVEERGPVLRAFLQQVRGGVRFFGSADSDAVAAAADRYPVFRLVSN